MRLLAAIGVVLLVLMIGAAGYAYFGFFNIAASDPHVDYVRWSLQTAQERSVERHAEREVGQAPPLDDPEMIRTGAEHFQEEGCVHCHGGPGMPQAEYVEYMRPEPPDLTRVASRWNDAELFWIMQHGIKMTGMPAFGPTHSEDELWAMVAFVRRLPDMSQSEFEELTPAAEGEGHHAGESGDAGHHSGDEAAASENGGDEQHADDDIGDHHEGADEAGHHGGDEPAAGEDGDEQQADQESDDHHEEAGEADHAH